jgi:hypothetical protein
MDEKLRKVFLTIKGALQHCGYVVLVSNGEREIQQMNIYENISVEYITQPDNKRRIRIKCLGHDKEIYFHYCDDMESI